jgi:tetratricopeptide (TPR) repeat protein
VTVRFRSWEANIGGDIALSRAGKPRHPVDIRSTKPSPSEPGLASPNPANPDRINSGRRNFLVRFCQGAASSMFPAGLYRQAFPSFYTFDSPSALPSQNDFQFSPHYRAQRPIEATLAKVRAGTDDFVTEKYHDQIAAILSDWSLNLLQSPRQAQAIAKALAPDFVGSSLRPMNSLAVRHGPPIEIRQNEFAPETRLGCDAFLAEFQSAMSPFSKLFTAEFQITSLATNSPSPQQVVGRLQTRVRYEFVGSSSGFYREQRVGDWDLEWSATPPSASRSEFQVQSWRALAETQSRSDSPVFVDIAAAALSRNPSYSAQMLKDADYWRTVLDGACGIDIYGHNGVSVADIDNDGFDDLYVCQPAGLPNRLYRNRGDGTFDDITESSGLGILENTACALFADFDNDGRQDVIVVRANGPLLFMNEGGGKFRRNPDAFRFATPPQGTFTGAAAADYDRDGWLDIYFCLYVYYQGTEQYKYPVPYHDAENGPPNFMMRNNRDGTFRDVTAESGLNKNNTRYSFCCGWSDYDGDGWPDLYVVNDFGRKNLYRNNGDGTFTDLAASAGVQDFGAGMSVCWFDYDNNSAQDIYVADMWSAAGQRISQQDIFKKTSLPEVRSLYQKHAMGNSLFRNGALLNRVSLKQALPHQAEIFQDRTADAGVGMGRWAWSSDAFDFDHDGFPDLYIANGMISGSSRNDLNSFFWRQVVANSPDTARPSEAYEQGWSAINELVRADGTWSGYERNVLYANNRDGTFSDISGVVGLDFIEDGRAFAFADFDNDGRQELFLKNRSGPQLRVLKNVMENLPPSISFRLRGTKSNRDAIGATVTIETEIGRQTRIVQAGSGFLSQHSKEILFGLGEAKGTVEASIRWPGGLVQPLRGLPLNHRIWVEEGLEAFRAEPFKTRPTVPGSPSVAPNPQETDALPATVETWLLAPIAAPDFSLPGADGKVRTLSAFRGKPVLLNFWVTASANCEEQLKLLNQVHSRWSAQGLELLTINLDLNNNNEKSVPEWLRDRHFSFSVLHGSDDVAAIYNLLYRYLFDRHRDLSLPTAFLIDPRGQIVKVYQGVVRPERIGQDFRNTPGTDADRLARALPFNGASETFEFGRNHLSYGSVFFQRGYFEQAAAFFQLALRDDPSSAEAAYGLGSAYLSQQKPTEARERFALATKLKASYPDTLSNSWNNLGLIAAQQNETTEAIRCFRQAVRLSSDHLIALNNLGNAYRMQKNWDAARETFAHALDVNPDDPEANYGLGMVFAQADDSARAYQYLKAALRARPTYPEALNNLGILYLRTQRRDEAVATFEECIRAAPAFDQSYLNLARVYTLEGAPGKARSVLLELLKQHPDHAQARNMLAQLPE